MSRPDPACQAAGAQSAAIAAGTRRVLTAFGLLFAFILAIASPAGWAQDGGLTLDELQQLWPKEETPPPDGARPRPPHAAEEPSEPSTGETDTRSLVQRTVDAWKRQKQAILQARELLMHPLAVPPPPSLSVECEDVDFNRMLTSQIVQTFVRQASERAGGGRSEGPRRVAARASAPRRGPARGLRTGKRGGRSTCRQSRTFVQDD